MLEFLTESTIIEINKNLGYSILNKSLVGSAISSWHYYRDVKDQIASVVLGITKNHAFSDGNKRTATVVYYALCDCLEIKPLSEFKMNIVILNIASSKNMSVITARKLLF
jgi:hypothetical protein